METPENIPFHVQLDRVHGELNNGWNVVLMLSEEIARSLVDEYEQDPSQYAPLLDSVNKLLYAIITVWCELRPLIKGDTLLHEGELMVINNCEFVVGNDSKQVVLTVGYADYDPRF
jgi:hypothetical protein